MRNSQVAVAALLLIATSCVANAQLIEQNGTDVTDPNGLAFSFQHEVTAFGEKFTNERRHYANRKSGRITLGGGTFVSIFDPLRTRQYHMLQPSEVFEDGKIAITYLRHSLLSEEQRTTIADLIHVNFWDSATFKPLGGNLFTWRDLRHEDHAHLTNTFQVAVIYNETNTYALYNYASMNFSGTDSGRKTLAGFSRGSRSYESISLPFSGANVVKLPTVSGISSQTPGRFIYRIDSWPPVRGGCLSQDPELPDDRVLSSTVTQDSILGGSLAIVSSRCTSPGSSGSCIISMRDARFESPTMSNCTNCNNTFHACRVPASYREGAAKLSLKINTQEVEYSTNFTFVSPDVESATKKITLSGSFESWMNLPSQSLQITYDPGNLRGELRLRVIGYSEFNMEKIDATNTPMKTLLEQAASAEGRMDVSSLSCPSGLSDCDTHHVGFLEISDSSAPPNLLRSRIIPLGWFVHKYYTDRGQPAWYREKCKSLSDSGSQTQKVREQLGKLTCPANLVQARAEADRFMRLTYCPELPGGCASATPKQQCFVSRPEVNADLQGTPASVCCYDETSENMLYQEMYTANEAWSQRGSKSIRSHPFGQPQSSSLSPGQVSFMSHWYWDILKYLYCCRWSKLGDCPFYFTHERPTPKISTFVAGRGSATVGDPHMTSFSGRPFLFNGYGEYWLLKSDDFNLQGRYLRLPSINSATFLVAVAFKVGTGPAFEARILSPGSAPRFRVQRRLQNLADTTTEVRLSSEFAYIEGGVTMKLNGNSNLVIQLSSNTQSVGVDLYAADEFDFMNAFVSVSDTLKDKTRGLLGRWTTDTSREFVDVKDEFVEFSANGSKFHEEFCYKNLLSNVGESLFSYEGSRANGFLTINRYERGTYTPVFTADGITPHGEETTVCQSDPNCVFDIRVTQDTKIAGSTAAQVRVFGPMQAAANASGGYCDKPNIRGIKLGADSVLREGASFTVSCADTLTASRSGGVTINCRRQGDGTLRWDPDPSTSGFACQLDSVDPMANAGPNTNLIIGICVPLAILLIAAVIGIIVYMRRRSSGTGGGAGGRPTPKPQQQHQQQHQLATSRTTIVSADSERGAFDNQGQANRRMTPQQPAGGNGGSGGPRAAPEAAADSMAPSAAPPADPHDDPSRKSYQQAQMEPLDPDEFNPNQYAFPPQRPQLGKSEVV